MKFFLYKTAIIFIVAFLLFEITIGYRITKYKAEIQNLVNKESLNTINSKIRSELRKANSKDQILNKDDKELLSTFINKIISELNLK